MLLAQRKRKQQLTGKIGHEGERYELGGPNNVAAPYAAHDPAPQTRLHDVKPVFPQPQHHRGHQLQPLKRQQTSILQEAPKGIPCTDFVPVTNKSNGHFPVKSDFGAPVPFVSALPPLHVMPSLPSPPAVKSFPMQFPSVYNGVVTPPACTPCLFSEQQQPMPHNLPSQLLPLTVNQTPPRAASTPRSMVGKTFNNQNNDDQTSGFSTGVISPYPQGELDSKEARREKRNRALELQKENARLCEERQLSREKERRLRIEEERRQEGILHHQREDITRKERQEMRREDTNTAAKVIGQEKHETPRTATDEHPHQNQVKEKDEKWQKQEETAAYNSVKSSHLTEMVSIKPLVQPANNVNYDRMDGDSITVEKKVADPVLPLQPLQPFTPFLHPSFSTPVTAPNAQTPSFIFPPLDSFMSAENLPPFDATAPPLFPSAMPVNSGMAVTQEFLAGVGFGKETSETVEPQKKWSPPPCSDGVVKRSLTGRTDHLQSQLQDMILEHDSIQRMLLGGVQPKHSLISSPPPGVMKKPHAQSGGIKVLGVNLPVSAQKENFLARETMEEAISPFGCDELSAEPSKFVGAVRYPV